MLKFISSDSQYGVELFDSYLAQRKEGDGLFTWSNKQIKSHVKKHQMPWVGLAVEGELLALVLFHDLKNIIEINYLETRVGYLRRGFMRKLLTHFFGEWSEHGIWLDVHESNIPGQKLYTELGFKQTGLRKGYYRDGGTCMQLSREAQA